MEPAMTMLLVSLVTWIIWSHYCCWNCIIAISIRRQLHRPHHRHLASNFCWVRIFLISFMNGVKQPKGKIRTRFCSDLCPKVMKLSSFVTFISMVSEIIAINWKKLPFHLQIFRRRSIRAIETIWAVSHPFSSSASTSAWIIFASTFEDSDVQLRCQVSDGCGETARHSIESIVCRFNAKCQFTRFILLFDVTTPARKWWNQVRDFCELSS